MSTILSIDQGTTNTKVLLLSAQDGAILAQASAPVPIYHPQPGWTEQSAEAIWESVVQAVRKLESEVALTELAAVAVANQRETVVAWDAQSGVALAPAVSWQCLRSADLCEELRARGVEQEVLETTGLGLDPLFPSGKLTVLLRNAELQAAMQAGRLRVGTVDSWLIWRLTGGRVHATDAGNAARTQLMAIDRLEWDAAMLALFEVPLAILPEIRASDAGFGVTSEGGQLPANVPIAAVMGDSHAALFGHSLREGGVVKVTMGTGSSLMAPASRRPKSSNGLASTVAWRWNGETRYALEGNVAVSGHAAAFATRMLGLPDEGALTRAAQSVTESAGVTFVPALAGLGAPHWNADARGLLSGLSLATLPGHVARAVLEGIALQICDMFDAAARDLGAVPAALSVDGGATRNDLLMQLLSDVVERPVLCSSRSEVGALGIGFMAAHAMGLVTSVWVFDEPKKFHPGADQAYRSQIKAQWAQAVIASQNK